MTRRGVGFADLAPIRAALDGYARWQRTRGKPVSEVWTEKVGQGLERAGLDLAQAELEPPPDAGDNWLAEEVEPAPIPVVHATSPRRSDSDTEAHRRIERRRREYQTHQARRTP